MDLLSRSWWLLHPNSPGLWLPEINLHIAVTPSTYHAIGFELFSSFLAHFHFYYLIFYPNDRAGIFIPVYSQRD